MAQARLVQVLFDHPAAASRLEAHLDAIAAGRQGPYEAVEELLAQTWAAAPRPEPQPASPQTNGR
jgi:hypothetical protein